MYLLLDVLLLLETNTCLFDWILFNIYSITQDLFFTKSFTIKVLFFFSLLSVKSLAMLYLGRV